MNGRVYDPVVGRFVSPDPWIQDPKNSQSFNRYTYVWNNPLRYTDPTGEFVFTAIAIGFALWSFYDAADGVAGEIVDVALGEKTVGQAASDFATNKLTDIALDKLTLNATKLVPKKVKEAVVDKVVKKAKEVTNNLKGTPKTVNKPADTKKDTQSPKPDSECCFVAGTLVLTKDGYTPIEEIALGDLVWSKNIDTGEKDWKPVITLFKKYRPILALTVTSSNGEEKLIETTEDHPFYVAGKGWVNASGLLADDAIETDKLGYVIVASLVDAQRIDTTYNFEVEDFNTYYATTLNVLVHNCSGKNKEQLGLEKQLRNEQQVSELDSGGGRDITGPNADGKKPFRDADRAAKDHGGNASDYKKVKSETTTSSDGVKTQIHAVKNKETGELFEHKTKRVDNETF